MGEQRKRLDDPLPQTDVHIRFRLRSTLVAFGGATVKRMRWNRATLEYEEYGPEFEIKDFTGWEATITDIEDPEEEPIYGYARYWPDRQVFEVYDLRCNV